MADESQYAESLEYLYGRLNYERQGMPKSTAELRLGRTRRLLRRLGDPQDSYPIVHVAGTKGKGSTSAMLAVASHASGRVTGLFCSPHLHRLEERFTVDGVEATEEELVTLTELVRPSVAAMDRESDRLGLRPLTFFDITCAMGLLHFARRGAKLVILEVGLGGRLDSTNSIRPAVSVITSISYDHMKQLGSTLGAIAGEKAGILKRGRPAVSGVRGEEARSVIERVAQSRKSPLHQIDVDIHYDYIAPLRPVEKPSSGHVHVTTWRRAWGPLPLPLIGPHQAHNMATALATLDVLAEQGFEVSEADVRRGFQRLRVPARVEVLEGKPCWVIDGAHNVASAQALASALETCFPSGPKTLVFGTTREKDLHGQLKALLPLFETIIVTKYVDNPRAVPPEDVAQAILEIDGRTALIASDPSLAIEVALGETRKDGLICVTGSLFLAAETRAILLGETSKALLTR